jgi:hypothetical protein
MNMGWSRRDPGGVYTDMAIRLAESLSTAGKKLRVFTNDPERLTALTGNRARLLTPVMMSADPKYPREMDFWAAHHKLNMIRQFGTEPWPNGMLDLDMILTQTAATLRDKLEVPAPMQGWVYDISSQVFPAYTRRVVQGDLKNVGDESAFPNWYGGEFLLGVPEFFERLSAECDRVLLPYFEQYKGLHHVGDELVISAAINACKRDFALGDAADSELVIRYWSSRPLHVQPALAVLGGCAFWHLPDMKWALSRDWIAHKPERLVYALRLRKMLITLVYAMRMHKVLIALRGKFKPSKSTTS